MQILGISTVEKDSKKSTTLFLASGFESYYNDKGAGRWAIGQRCEQVYIGTDIDCSALKVGQNIEIYYDKMVQTSNGRAYQKVKKIEVITK